MKDKVGESIENVPNQNISSKENMKIELYMLSIFICSWHVKNYHLKSTCFVKVTYTTVTICYDVSCGCHIQTK